jgi:hypothetical protein
VKTARLNFEKYLNKTERAELRHIAIVALRRAFPNWSQRRIAAELGIDGGTVRHHATPGLFKGRRIEDAPKWQQAIVNACVAVAEGDHARAYIGFKEVVAVLEQMNRKESHVT